MLSLATVGKMSAHEMLHHGWQFGQVLKFGEGPLSGARGRRPAARPLFFQGLFLGGGLGFNRFQKWWGKVQKMPAALWTPRPPSREQLKHGPST